jgi:SOS-response transcriptional repressor LexA
MIMEQSTTDSAIKMGMTPLQKRVLDFLREFIELHEYSPSMREIGSGCKMHISAVARVVDALQQRNHITRLNGVSRSITLLD